MLKLIYYVPLKQSKMVKEELFKIGVGKIGNYDSCCFETQGIGQFRPLDGANPTLGRHNEIEKVEEVKVEMVLHEDIAQKAVSTLKAAHPYEEVAYQVFQCLDF
jgi:hypothetical protein